MAIQEEIERQEENARFIFWACDQIIEHRTERGMSREKIEKMMLCYVRNFLSWAKGSLKGEDRWLRKSRVQQKLKSQTVPSQTSLASVLLPIGVVSTTHI
jgi:hypothetical protein